MSKIVFGLYALVMSCSIVFALGLVIGVEVNAEWAQALLRIYIQGAW